MNRHQFRGRMLLWVVPLLGAVALTACSSQQGGATVAGESVLVSGTTRVIWRSAGGGFYDHAIPVGAACHFESSYDLDMQAGSLGWSICERSGDPADPASYVTLTGSRTLDADERAQATAAVQAVTVSQTANCGANLDARTLQVDGPSGTIVYGDDFYACDQAFEHYVSAERLGALWIVLNGLAQPPSS